MLLHPLTQRGDLRQQPEHQLPRRLPTRQRNPFSIRHSHERKIPCAREESSRSPRHVNAYYEYRSHSPNTACLTQPR